GQHAILQGHTTAGRRWESFNEAYNVNSALRLRQRKTGVCRILAELGDQGVDPIESLDVPQPSDERDRHRFAIPIAADVEQMHFEASVDVAKRRTPAEVHHSAERAPRGLRTNGIYTIWWEKFASREQLEVDRRIAEVAPALIAVNDAAAHAVRA